jgi:hypothetical protein
MTFRYFLCASLLILSLLPLGARAQTYAGTWLAYAQAGSIDLRLNYRRSDLSGNHEIEQETDVPYAQLRGITSNQFQSTGVHGSFALVRDAGTFNAEGWFAHGSGSGSWSFSPSEAFRRELQRRGIGVPNDYQQLELALMNARLATVDGLLAAGFQRPSVEDVVRMYEHGVDDRYIQAMRGVPMQPKTVEGLIRMRDHGVSTGFIAALARFGYGTVSAEDVTRMMDHGVSANYLEGLQRLGYHPQVDDVVRLADHGVSIDFIARMRSHGYTHLSADDLIRLRDHGF